MPKTLKDLEIDINGIGKKFQEAIFGNGGLGLKARVARLEVITVTSTLIIMALQIFLTVIFFYKK